MLQYDYKYMNKEEFWMNLDLLKKRRSVHKYSSQPIEIEKLETIIDAARFAPTAHNEQPWEFIVIINPTIKQQLASKTEFGKYIIDEAAACIAVFCRDTKYYLEDGSAVTTYILLAATGLGIGSCWLSGDKKSYTEEVRLLLEVPKGYRLVSFVALGYPADDHRSEKRSLKEVLHWNKFIY
jgi:nitroreductase